MIDLLKEKQEILSMNFMGETKHFNWSEGGGAEIHRFNDQYLLYEVPLFGGKPCFNKVYDITEVDKMIEEYRSYT